MNLIIHLPDHWTDQQAEFMHDLVELLHEALWRQYGLSLCEYWERQDKEQHQNDDD